MLAFVIFFIFDLYVFSGLYSWFNKPLTKRHKFFTTFYWLFTLLTYFVPAYYREQNSQLTGQFPYSFIFSIFVGVFIIKLFYSIFLLVNDLSSLFRFLFKKTAKTLSNRDEGKMKEQRSEIKLSRSQFLLKTGALMSTAPAAAMTFGIASGAHDYRVRKSIVKIKDLPKELEGITIGQISDIHAGSFWNKTAVQGGVDMLNAQKPDLVCFTGDLVNNVASEINNYVNVFNKIKADLGVYSVIGNHDYGRYVVWETEEEKEANFRELKRMHKVLGWDLLLNENRVLDIDGEKLGLIGVENWSRTKRFPSTGDLVKAKLGSEDVQTKVLLSHDPTHWRGEVLKKEHKDINLTLSGHTHGMQLGVETENYKWSPVQYLYKEWAGLYSENQQNLYVNRGYGYLGFPGRLGILPELTILELSRA